MSCEKICPSVEEILQDMGQKNIPCPQPDCGKILAQTGALHLHLTKVHKIFQSEESIKLFHGIKNKEVEYQFHCPVTTCKYNIKFPRYFKTRTALKQHYKKVHVEKKFKCPKCSLPFFQQSQQTQHTRTCNITVMCSACHAQYKTKYDLYVHCVEHNHKYMFQDLPITVTSGNQDIATIHHSTTDVISKTNLVKDHANISILTKDSTAKKSLIPTVRIVPRSSIKVLNSTKTNCTDNHKKESAMMSVGSMTAGNIDSVSTKLAEGQSKNVVGIDVKTNHTNNTEPSIVRKNLEEDNKLQNYCIVKNVNEHNVELSKSTIIRKIDNNSVRSNFKVSTSEGDGTLTFPAEQHIKTRVGALQDDSSLSTSVNCSPERNCGTVRLVKQISATKNIPILNSQMIGNEITETISSSNPIEGGNLEIGKDGSSTVSENSNTVPRILDATPVNLNESHNQTVLLSADGFSPNNYLQSLRQIAPKLPSPMFMIIPPNFQGNIVMNTSNYFMGSSPNFRSILPKVSAPVTRLNPVRAPVIIQPTETEPQTSQFESSINELLPSTSTQTLVSAEVPKQQQTSTETQTAGDCILKKAMRSAKVPIVKESRASQVSPRAKLKRTNRERNTSETQTQMSPRLNRKRRRKSFVGRDSGVNTDSPGKGVNYSQSKRNRCHDVSVQEIQTETECVLPLPSVEDMARIVESISTQTADSYLATCTQIQGVDNTRDSEMQTRLHMDMTLDACNPVDMESLQQLGLAMQQDQQANINPPLLDQFSSSVTYVPPRIGDMTSDSLKHSSRIRPRKSRGSADTVSTNRNSKQVTRNRNTSLQNQASDSMAYSQRRHTATSTISKAPPSYEEATNIANKLKDPMFSPPASELANSDSQSSTMGFDQVPPNPQFPTNISMGITGNTADAATSDFDLPSLLSAEVQTVAFDSLYSTNIQTQTETDEGLLSEMLTHMETQTTDDFWSELGFSSTQTQTGDASFETGEVDAGVQAETQTGLRNTQHNVEVQASIQHMENPASDVISADTETQTLFENLTDSHTQTSWKDLMKIVKELN